MTSRASLLSPSTYHILSYGTLLGTTVYQSFVNGIVAYRVLPRPQFASLQTALTPVYFAIQTVLPISLALTYPRNSQGAGGIHAILQPQNKYAVFAPLLGMFATAAVNLIGLGPATTKVMKQRKHQETKDGKKYWEKGDHSRDMQALNKKFSRLHGINALINMAGLGFMLWYGAVLGERLQ